MTIHEVRKQYAQWVRETMPDADEKLHLFWQECRQHDFDLAVHLAWIYGCGLAAVCAELVVLR